MFPLMRYHEAAIRHLWRIRNFQFDSYQPNYLIRKEIIEHVEKIRAIRIYLTGQSNLPIEFITSAILHSNKGDS